ncbi:MAG: ARMT1-like domain-containing protein [Candidatus Thermoplasmatota archaeon]|nr:ARMT1-like domain-containing protein [Candidatus Thermoplasmatota archaeon]
MEAQCVPCVLNRIVYECSLAKVSKKRSAEILKACAAVVGREFGYGKATAEVSTKVHRLAYKMIGKDPYAGVKKLSNEIALELMPKVEKIVANSKDPLKSAVLASIIGNSMDFGIIGSKYTGPEHLRHEFDTMFKEGLGVDDVEKMKKYMKPEAKIVLATDNCGEIVFDKLLAQEIKKSGAYLTVIVRGGVILTDATRQDALALGFDKIADRILDTNHKGGIAAVGFSFNEIKPEVKKALADADLIVSKGMGNYEAFENSKYKPIIFLMRTKCGVVAESINLPKNINVAKLIE